MQEKGKHVIYTVPYWILMSVRGINLLVNHTKGLDEN